MTGDLGVSPGSAVVGFPPGIVNGTIHAADGLAGQAAADMLTAYNQAAGEPCDFTLSNADLGGMTLLPGVYCFTSTSVGITGALTLNPNGNANAAWVFKIGSTLTTASDSAVELIGGASPCNNNNITWQVGSRATVGTAASFLGNILASASITLATAANIVRWILGDTTIAYLKVGSTVVIAKPTAVAPNTTISVGVLTLVLNERIPFTAPDAGLTVNAVHLTAGALGLVNVNLVVASSQSDIGNCP